MNPGIMFLKVGYGAENNHELGDIKLYYNNTVKSMPKGYGAASIVIDEEKGQALTAISTLNTFNNMNNNKNLIEAYRAEAINYKPVNCTANTFTWEFTYSVTDN